MAGQGRKFIDWEGPAGRTVKYAPNHITLREWAAQTMQSGRGAVGKTAAAIGCTRETLNHNTHPAALRDAREKCPTPIVAIVENVEGGPKALRVTPPPTVVGTRGRDPLETYSPHQRDRVGTYFGRSYAVHPASAGGSRTPS